MKKLILMFLAAAGLIAALAGCRAADSLASGIAEKSISGSGTVVVSRVGLDKTTQTPELFNLFVWGDYTSVVPGDEVMRYEASEDASIFNSSAKSKKIKMFYSSGDKKRMDKFLAAVRRDAEKRLLTEGDSAALGNKADSAVAADGE